AGITALLLASSLYIAGDLLIPLLSKDMQVQLVASAHLGYAAIYIALSFVAFQLDGIFIGVTKSVEMRNATLMALIIFIGSGLWLTLTYGNDGFWIRFIIYVVARDVMLGLYYPNIGRQMAIN